ncbi:uncharacterized protein LOC132382943 isoform X1 [Hypanus sabinus]|uniref:uncharacterized protein LOC132382943 isoform X1 n=1 Tax=Hypanus sabinus TaxID=79690 RepID=UPI0028C49313|nr:uncharacterized protein LOC132382943 isoform X1 [Hypanus sabinus]XP_059809528.1 uncharacterized protein LOC132382943 isoform X1 [Hypanus sabinus]XP_059809529.1 uncharacterized protein LOC132382943 isoform X1 [Hypanus sabinus]
MSSQKPLLCPWLITQVDSGQYPGLCWVNKEKRQFRIPWKHCLRQNISSDDVKIFEAWAIASGRYRAGVDVPNPPVWKRNFRSALARKKHFRRVQDNRSDPLDPHLIYEIHNSDFPEGNSPSSSDQIQKQEEDEEEEEVSEEDMEEEGHLTSWHLPLSTFSNSATLKAEDMLLEGCTSQRDIPGTSGLQPAKRQRENEAQALRRESPHSSTAPEDVSENFDREAFRKRLVQMHGEMLGSLSSLSDRMQEMARSMEVSVSNLAQEVLWSQDSLSSSVEAIRSSIPTGMDATAMQRLMDRVLASMEAQEEAVQSLCASVEAQGNPSRALLAVSREQVAVMKEQREAVREQIALLRDQREATRERVALQHEQIAALREQRATSRKNTAVLREQTAVLRDLVVGIGAGLKSLTDAVQSGAQQICRELAARPRERPGGVSLLRTSVLPRGVSFSPRAKPSPVSHVKVPRAAAPDGSALQPSSSRGRHGRLQRTYTKIKQPLQGVGTTEQPPTGSGAARRPHQTAGKIEHSPGC